MNYCDRWQKHDPGAANNFDDRCLHENSGVQGFFGGGSPASDHDHLQSFPTSGQSQVLVVICPYDQPF